MSLVGTPDSADRGMELPEHIYLQSCDECGMPALTYDDQGNARCVEHAAVFIPAEGVASESDEES